MKTDTSEILEQVEDILNIGIALSTQKDHNQILAMIVSEARRITRADAGTLYLLEGDHLLFKITQNDSMKLFKGGMGEHINLPPVILCPENVSAYVAMNKQIVNIPDVYKAEGFDFSGPKEYDQITGYRTISMLVIPLENHEGQVIGVLQLLNAKDEEGYTIPFAPYYVKVISSLASQAAISLTNMQFLTDIDKIFHSFVEVMTTAIDSRTPYTANHTRRVARLAGELANLIDMQTVGKWADVYFDEDRTAQLVMAGWLHDIGKIVTPLAVMNKASRIEAQIELVLQRLELIEAYLKMQYLEEKLSLKDNADHNTLIALDNNWREKKYFVQETRDLIKRVNNPATLVDNEIIEQLKEVASLTYLDQEGNHHPWLTETELTALSVAKGTLTESERQVIEEHVSVTKCLLDKIPFCQKLKKVPFFASIHHERLDGKGYPYGLTGDDIPLEGRILALVDVFDALTAADRPYKKAFSIEQALKTLEFMATNSELDEDLFKLFIENTVWERVEC